MKDFAEGIALLAEQARIIETANAERARLKQEMVERFSPVKIGEIVTANSGFAHQGKRMMVTAITVRDKSSYRGEVGFIATGKALKKDGTPGENAAEHYAEP